MKQLKRKQVIKILFSNVFKKRGRKDYYRTLIMGVRSVDEINTNVVSPWLYTRIFLILTFGSLLSLIICFFNSTPAYIILTGGLVFLIPAIFFLFETDYSREVNIFQLIVVYVFGGLLSILATLIFSVFSFFVPGEGILTVVIVSPVLEEISKALVVLVAFRFARPKSLHSALLIGFTIGAGFCAFENCQYAMNEYGTSIFVGRITNFNEATASFEEPFFTASMKSIELLLLRTIIDTVSGHHYFTMIFSSLAFLGCKQNSITQRLKTWKTYVSLLPAISLHIMWNGASVIKNYPLKVTMMVLNGAICLYCFCFLLRRSLSQFKQIRYLAFDKIYKIKDVENSKVNYLVMTEVINNNPQL